MSEGEEGQQNTRHERVAKCAHLDPATRLRAVIRVLAEEIEDDCRQKKVRLLCNTKHCKDQGEKVKDK